MSDFGWESELASLADKTDQEAADAIAELTVTSRQLVPLWKIAELARTAGWWLTAKAAATTNQYAAAFFEYYADPRFDNLDMDLATTKAAMNGLVAAGLITQAQADAVDALADVTELKYPQGCYAGQVKTAREQLQ